MKSVLSDKLFQALVQLQKNKIYIGKTENELNDGLRDMLNMVFECADQTRQGVSEEEIDSGEVDILIKDKGIPVSIIEAMRLRSMERQVLSKHIDKVLTKYDFNGCKIVNIVIYAFMVDFGSFWTKCSKYLSYEYNYPFELSIPFVECETNLSETKHGITRLIRSGSEISLHFYAVHMRE